MGFFARLARSFGLILVICGGAAEASEVMHMPFECRFDGARVRLRPSEEHAYAIIGRREREVFTTCAPGDPDRCSSWLVHRFEFDCNGDRVAWIDAAAAATRFADWDAWIDDGSFRMRMDARWGVARARSFQARRRMMRRRYFGADERDGFGPDEGDVNGGRIVTVPLGFAPSVSIPLTFSGGGPEVAEIPDASPQDRAVAVYGGEPERAPAPQSQSELQSGPQSEQAASPSAPNPDLPERAPPVEQRVAAAEPPVVAPAPVPATPLEAPAPQEQPTADPDVTANAKAAEPATSDEAAGGMTVINGPRPVPTEPASPAAPATTSSQSANAAARIETNAVEAPMTLRAQPSPTPVSPDTAADTVAPPSSPPSASAPSPSLTMPALDAQTVAAAVATSLALAGLAVFGVVRWRRRSPAPQLANRDIGDITLDGGRKGLTHERAPAASEADASARQNRETPAEASDMPVPTTYAEALEVLGASPDASTAAIKKIVDGLRQSWHPDHARSEADRLRREARLRQVNVAWDLVSQRRSAA